MERKCGVNSMGNVAHKFLEISSIKFVTKTINGPKLVTYNGQITLPTGVHANNWSQNHRQIMGKPHDNAQNTSSSSEESTSDSDTSTSDSSESSSEVSSEDASRNFGTTDDESSDEEQNQVETNTKLWANYQNYLVKASSFGPFTTDQVVAIKLLLELRKTKASLGACDALMTWHLEIIMIRLNSSNLERRTDFKRDSEWMSLLDTF